MTIKAQAKKIRALLRAKKSNQSGFTLLELLVVVAILAAIAGTATIALKDTDARASAAAHVTMMDELNKGIRTYRVLQRNTLPNRFDSLMMTATTGDASAAVPLENLGFDGTTDAAPGTITDDVAQILIDGGIAELQYVDNTLDADGTDTALTCAVGSIRDLIMHRGNSIVAGNIFMSPDANGCGFTHDLVADDPVDASNDAAALYWNGGTERLTGQEDPAGVGSAYDADDNYAYLLTGIGPSSSLFDANTLGGMTTVPVYRHVKPDEYNRFVAVWNVGTYSGGAIVAGAQAELVAIVDGALDTKEEELGEWDGSRNTI
jgi:prepilin-type N-terminal cleavage/methylation domain-containing protein